jgi:hypothetical protein
MIRPEEIDPTIQNALKERLSQLFTQQAALDPTSARVRSAGMAAWKEAAKRYTAHYWAAGLMFASSILSLPLMGGINEGLGVLGFFGLAAGGMAVLIGTNRRLHRQLTQYVSPDVMRGAAHLVALSRAEKLYCEAVAALIDAGRTVGEGALKEILAQLNELLASYRKLEAPLQRYRAASASQSVETLEQELAELTLRRDAQEDATARATMDQSIGLCAQRLEHARRMEPAREQAEAQQELICQTLASMQASLARIAGAGSAPAATEVNELRDSVTAVNRQTHAVEEAVTEVMALSA